MYVPRVLTAALLAALVAPCAAFEIQSTVAPWITAQPIEIVVWVKPGVSPENEARVLAEIERGLQMWEDVETSEIRFRIVSVMHTPSNPGKLPHQISITVGNLADLTSGGASLPSGGYPGTWYGVVADVPEVRTAEVTAHEIGHTLGLLHSTIDLRRYPWEQCPIMRFAIGSPVLRADDVAAISLAYPERGGPRLADVAGRIRGRVVVAGSALGLTGVNVVAEDVSTGVGAVARISGFSGSAGSFDLPGLPPGDYVLKLLDAQSYRGCCLRPWAPNLEMSGGYQADNFAESTLGPLRIGPGDDLDVGDLALTIEPLEVDAAHVGPVGSSTTMEWQPVRGTAPIALVERPYEVWLRLRGGVRDLFGTISGLPPGLSGTVRVDPRYPNVGVHGAYYAHIAGQASVPGDHPFEIRTTDRRGVSETVVLDLPVRYEGAEAVPDLAVEMLPHSPETPRPLETVTLTADVRNVGDARSERALLTFSIAGITVETLEIAPLAPDEVRTASTVVRLPRGVWPYEAVADLPGELDRRDNRAISRLTVGSPLRGGGRPVRRSPEEPR